MKKYSSFLIIALLLTSVSCQEDFFESLSMDREATIDNVLTPRVVATETDSYCGKMVYWLKASPTLSAGNTTVANDANNLYVTIYVYDGFQEVENNVKVWVGLNTAFDDLTDYGTVRPTEDQYQYKATAPSGNYTGEYTISIPLADIEGYDPGNCGSQYVYVIANAEVLVPNGDGTYRGESAYGGNREVIGDDWWYYLKYLPLCCEEPPVYEYTSETAFAYGTHVFVSPDNKKANPDLLFGLNLTKNRWGWAINLRGEGEYTYKIYAGAGLNRTLKATEVGELTVNYTGSTVLVEYNLYPEFTMNELHLYVSNDVPTSIAPGQYGNTVIFDPKVSSYSSEFDVEDGIIWIIAHAVVQIPVD